ncbi:hypothetical protein [Promicromonospora aerolata]|uniref:T6SS immunity protein Tdi1 C-terminal domain-containing protein n=1 Tax=Promicromonospora aerolata TaxID=195749 RepID=A0ABW4V846_9MICO
MHLIREFAPDAYEFALSSWSWIGTGDKTPRFASCFGDMFLESADGWWFLDTVEGTLERLWGSMDDMFAELERPDGRAEYLLEETLSTALGQGLRLDDDEVFAFLPPPAVTGTMSVDSLAPLRFAIAANLAGRIHGELNGVQPDAGASALFAAQQLAGAPSAGGQNVAGQGVPSFDAPNPQTDRWEPTAQRVDTGAYPAYRPTPEPGYAGGLHESTAPARAAYQQAGYETRYPAGSELDYGSGQPQGYGTGAYTAAPAEPSASLPAGGYEASGGRNRYDYVDNAHTADSGQFSQYIADQYNTGQVAAVERGAPVPARPGPHQDGRWSYA